MNIHRIRLKAPWLVTASEKGTPIGPLPGGEDSKTELPELIQQLLAARSSPLELRAVRRFHRPTGLDRLSQLSLSITSPCPPDRVLCGPIAPGEQESFAPECLLPGSRVGDCIEFALPSELQLRNELRLEWDELSPRSSLEAISVELLIRAV